MDSAALAQALWADIGAQRWDALAAYFLPGALIFWHNTDECFTAEEFVRANREYPGNWRIEIERVHALADAGGEVANIDWMELLSTPRHFLRSGTEKSSAWMNIGAMTAPRRSGGARWASAGPSKGRTGMAANDYLMRQIEDMARFLGKVLFVKTEETIPLFDEQGNVLESGLLYKRLCAMLEEGDANSAENLLFDEVEAHPDPAYLQVAVQFYADLQHWTDAALEAADFSRQEVLDGLAAVKELYEKRAGGQKAKE